LRAFWLPVAGICACKTGLPSKPVGRCASGGCCCRITAARSQGRAMLRKKRSTLPVRAAAIALPDLATRINHEHKAAVGTLKRGLEHALAAGHLLHEAKQLVPHGQWLPWLAQSCRIPERTAQVYMRLARRLPKSARPADLTITQALEMLLDAPGDLEIPNAFPSCCDYPAEKRPPIVSA
jgi:hypothetical protein